MKRTPIIDINTGKVITSWEKRRKNNTTIPSKTKIFTHAKYVNSSGDTIREIIIERYNKQGVPVRIETAVMEGNSIIEASNLTPNERNIIKRRYGRK